MCQTYIGCLMHEHADHTTSASATYLEKIEEMLKQQRELIDIAADEKEEDEPA